LAVLATGPWTESDTQPDPALEATIQRAPLAFEPNAGRTDPRVDFIAHSVAGGSLFLTPRAAALELPQGRHDSRVLRIGLVGSDPQAQPHGLAELPGKANSFIGDDPSHWRSGIPTYEHVRYSEVYPGIDLEYYGNQRRLEYDFRLAPRADPKQIRLNLRGADSVRVAADGDLVIGIGKREIRQAAPVAYQRVGGERRMVESSYELEGDRVGFRLGAYDRSRPLVIDPVVLTYSTYLGGDAGDFGNAIAVDGSGAAYVTGQVVSTDFPTQDQFQPPQANNAFVTKLDPDGGGAVTLAYSTYLGGGDTDVGTGIAVDSAGAAYVTGRTQSTDFPPQDQFQLDQPAGDAFVTKLDPDVGGAVTLAYSTYLGGASPDDARGIAVDSNGAAYVTGGTSSTAFPTQDPYQTDQMGPDAFVTKVNPDPGGATAVTLAYSTYLGGAGGGSDADAGQGIAVDSNGAAYVVGSTETTNFPTSNQFQTDQPSNDAFVTKLNTDFGSAVTLAYSTYLGGGGDDFGNAIAVDSGNAAYVTGQTGSSNFPTQDPFQADQPGYDVFVTKLDPFTGFAVTLAYSTYLGGGLDEAGTGIAVDSTRAAYLTGYTDSTNFPTQDPFQTDNPTVRDAYATKVSPDAGGPLTLGYSTYLGATDNTEAHGIAVDGSGAAAYVTGQTSATDFPTQDEFQADPADGTFDAFVTRLTYTPPSPPPGGGGGGGTVPLASAPGPTGQRAAALKKCKKKTGRAKKRCKKRANQLPV